MYIKDRTKTKQVLLMNKGNSNYKISLKIS